MAHYELPKQMDGHNCGIFIYMVMDTLSKPIGNEFDPIRCRLKIFEDSNGGISPLLKAQRNRQIFTVNLEQEIAKGIGREELLKRYGNINLMTSGNMFTIKQYRFFWHWLVFEVAQHWWFQDIGMNARLWTIMSILGVKM
ncbi:hypothetical protein HELRODRAFT_169212 [Helobdella robusta]|uniref:Uncharacterized protein n=1 Tax=Helobdella robusta TaxID=6412 RepID=T1F1K9_HELRO|nr:hypothetical protein HELRODRAFT_169212 [Helobdella robusta]ESO08387.1 hypothetical protein HELRODRAFT_169212 [Helobdella robusta]